MHIPSTGIVVLPCAPGSVNDATPYGTTKVFDVTAPGPWNLPSGPLVPGTTLDCAPAINATLRYASQQCQTGLHGAVVYLPPGRYFLGSTILLDGDNVALRGAGVWSTILVRGVTPSNPLTLPLTSPPIVGIRVAKAGGGPILTPELRGFTILWATRPYPGTSLNITTQVPDVVGVVLEESVNAHVEDVGIQTFGVGLYLLGNGHTNTLIRVRTSLCRFGAVILGAPGSFHQASTTFIDCHFVGTEATGPLAAAPTSTIIDFGVLAIGTVGDIRFIGCLMSFCRWGIYGAARDLSALSLAPYVAPLAPVTAWLLGLPPLAPIPTGQPTYDANIEMLGCQFDWCLKCFVLENMSLCRVVEAYHGVGTSEIIECRECIVSQVSFVGLHAASGPFAATLPGLRLRQTTLTGVTGCTFRNCRVGIEVDSSSLNTITGNTFSWPGFAADTSTAPGYNFAVCSVLIGRAAGSTLADASKYNAIVGNAHNLVPALGTAAHPWRAITEQTAPADVLANYYGYNAHSGQSSPWGFSLFGPPAVVPPSS